MASSFDGAVPAGKQPSADRNRPPSGAASARSDPEKHDGEWERALRSSGIGLGGIRAEKAPGATTSKAAPEVVSPGAPPDDAGGDGMPAAVFSRRAVPEKLDVEWERALRSSGIGLGRIRAEKAPGAAASNAAPEVVSPGAPPDDAGSAAVFSGRAVPEVIVHPDGEGATTAAPRSGGRGRGGAAGTAREAAPSSSPPGVLAVAGIGAERSREGGNITRVERSRPSHQDPLRWEISLF